MLEDELARRALVHVVLPREERTSLRKVLVEQHAERARVVDHHDQAVGSHGQRR
jgi:hypothetical protein